MAWRKGLEERMKQSDVYTTEQEEFLEWAIQNLKLASGDGERKRRSNQKVNWKIDTGHEGSLFSHIAKWKKGQFMDPGSGAHPLVHAAWRALAIAYQERRMPTKKEFVADIIPAEFVQEY